MVRRITFARLITAFASWLGYSAVAQAEFFGAISGGIQAGQVDARVEGVPNGLIHVSPDLPNVLWVDLDRGAMHLLEQTRPGWFTQERVIPVSIGKSGFGKALEGDLKTPVGVYHVTQFLSDAKLADKYGNGAFPLNYPNIEDRLSQRTGSGIWLHGLPKGVHSRPQLDSDGCVVVDNETLDSLRPLILENETLVVLSPDFQWSTKIQPAHDQLLKTIEQWREDWQTIDNNAYLGHYDISFTDTKRDITAWKAYKTRVNSSKRRIRVELEKLSVVEYPGQSDLATVRFYQIYESSNYQWRGWKQLLWRMGSDGQWRIVYEGNG